MQEAYIRLCTNSSGNEIDASCPIVTENDVVVVGNNLGGIYYAFEDQGTAGVLLDTFTDQRRACASTTMSPDGILYLPLQTNWYAENGDLGLLHHFYA